MDTRPDPSSHFPICSRVIPVFLRTVPDQSFCVAAPSQLFTLAFPASFPESLATDRQSERGQECPPPLDGLAPVYPAGVSPGRGRREGPGRPVVQPAPHCSGLMTPSLPSKASASKMWPKVGLGLTGRRA